jgi:hypothetical protein
LRAQGGAVFGDPEAWSLSSHRRRSRGEKDLSDVAQGGLGELQSEHFKAIFEVHGSVPTKGRIGTARFTLGAIFVCQLALLHRHERKPEVNLGLKAFLRAA